MLVCSTGSFVRDLLFLHSVLFVLRVPQLPIEAAQQRLQGFPNNKVEISFLVSIQQGFNI